MKNSFDFIWFFFLSKGCIGRQSYILGMLLIGIFQIFPLYRMMLVPQGGAEQQFWLVLFWLSFLLTFWPNFVLTIKRLHDLGLSGFLSVFFCIPFLSFIMFAALSLLPGKVYGNPFLGQTDNSIE